MNLLNTFKQIAVAEGVSFLAFAVTMPLKYGLDITTPNYIVGMIHGALFIAYCILGLRCAIIYKWSFGFSLLVFVASLLPFATFVLKARYLKD